MRQQAETESTFSFEAYALMSLARIHAVSCDTERSYDGYSHQSAIDQLYYSIPSDKKKKFIKRWDAVVQKVIDNRGLQKSERVDANIAIVAEKMQIVSDLLDSLNLLFSAPNQTLENWLKAKKRGDTNE